MGVKRNFIALISILLVLSLVAIVSAGSGGASGGGGAITDTTPPGINFIFPEDNLVVTEELLSDVTILLTESWKVEKIPKKLEMTNNDAPDSIVEGETIRDITVFIGEEELSVLADNVWNVAGKDYGYGYQQFLFFDSKDKKIIEQLQKNCRQTIAEIAKATKLRRDVVVYRIKKLEKM